MKKGVSILIIAGLLALGGQAFGELCSIDAVPAATLLLPYFEVDLTSPAGVTTLFSINNASAAPALAHVVLWTNWSAPTIDFDLFLTGYDVQTVNLRDVFNGILPITSDDSQDGNDAISPHANNPIWDGDFPQCDAFLPFPGNPAVTGTAFSRLINGHTGQPVPSLGGNCLGADIGNAGPDVAVGYLTVDNVSQCSLVLDPSDPLYFVDGGTGIANDINQLWGDWFLVDPANNFAQGDVLVHIEANPGLNAANIPLLNPDTGATVANVANATGYTFYGRYTFPGGGDNREPLGTTWGTRYFNDPNGPFNGGTQLLVWRDSTANNLLPAGATCGVGPNWFPLNETQVVAFDEAEDAVEICFFTGGRISPPEDNDPPCFPYETGRYQWGVDPLDVPFPFGWAYLNLNLPPDAPTGDRDFGTSGNIAQSYVTTVHNASGLFSVGLSAVELTDACQDLNPFIVGNIPFF